MGKGRGVAEEPLRGFWPRGWRVLGVSCPPVLPPGRSVRLLPRRGQKTQRRPRSPNLNPPFLSPKRSGADGQGEGRAPLPALTQPAAIYGYYDEDYSFSPRFSASDRHDLGDEEPQWHPVWASAQRGPFGEGNRAGRRRRRRWRRCPASCPSCCCLLLPEPVRGNAFATRCRALPTPRAQR